jgi:hypothetical protein
MQGAVENAGITVVGPFFVDNGSDEEYRNVFATLRSVLLICAFSTACICRVSTQTAGNSASARALNSHCDSGPASSPIRLKR